MPPFTPFLSELASQRLHRIQTLEAQLRQRTGGGGGKTNDGEDGEGGGDMEDEEDDGDARITALAGGLGPGENMLEVWIKGGQLTEGAGGGLLDKAATTFVMCGTSCQWRKGGGGDRVGGEGVRG